MTNLQKKLLTIATFNWKPKLVCLALAIIIWLVVDRFFVQSTSDKVWNLDDIRLSLPD